MANGELMVVAGEASGDLHAADVLAELRRRRPELRAFGMGGPRLEARGAGAAVRRTGNFRDGHRGGPPAAASHLAGLPDAGPRRPRAAARGRPPGGRAGLQPAPRAKAHGGWACRWCSTSAPRCGPGAGAASGRLPATWTGCCASSPSRRTSTGRTGCGRATWATRWWSRCPHPVRPRASAARSGSSPAGSPWRCSRGAGRASCTGCSRPWWRARRCWRRTGRSCRSSCPWLRGWIGRRWRRRSPRAGFIPRWWTDAPPRWWGPRTWRWWPPGPRRWRRRLMLRPMVVVYRMSALSWAVGRLLVRVAFVSLVNLLSGRRLVPELLQSALRPEAVAAEVRRAVDAGRGARGTARGSPRVAQPAG